MPCLPAPLRVPTHDAGKITDNNSTILAIYFQKQMAAIYKSTR